jgi:hypothetical protein
VVMASLGTISVNNEWYEQGHRRDRFRACQGPCCQGHLTGSTWKGTILVFGKMLELEMDDNEITAFSTKMTDEKLLTSSSGQIWSKNAF